MTVVHSMVPGMDEFHLLKDRLILFAEIPYLDTKSGVLPDHIDSIIKYSASWKIERKA